MFREPEILTDSQFLSHFEDSSHDYCSDYEVSVVKLYKKNIWTQLKTWDNQKKTEINDKKHYSKDICK
jgi:hypothetical protein